MDNKSLINLMSERLDLSADEVEARIKTLVNIMAESVKQGDTVALPGFGTFEPKLKKDRVAVHPSTGKKLLVPPKLTIVFKPSAILKQKVRK